MTTKLGTLLLLAALAALAACGGDDAADETTDTTAATETEATDAPTDALDDASHDPSATTQPGTVEIDPWRVNAVEHREDIGDEFDYECPADGTPASVWGTDDYTDDSGICTAAVHAGLITFDEGGDVTIVMAEGRDRYAGTERNGVSSQDFGEWPAGFAFVDED